MYVQVTVQVLLITKLRPLHSQRETLLELFNEVVTLLSTYLVMCCSSWIPDEDDKLQIGYLLIFVVSSHLFVHLSLILKGTLCECNQRYCVIGDKERSENAKKKRRAKKVEAKK